METRPRNRAERRHPELLDTPGVSDLLGVSAKTLAHWRLQGTGPDYVRVGRHVRYQLSAIERWLDQQTTKTAPAA